MVRFTSEELAAMRAEGENRTDWERAGVMTGDALAASVAADPDEAGTVFDWSRAMIEMPRPKAVLNMRVDADVLAFFKQPGPGYQTRIHAVLRAFMEAQQRRAG